MVAISMIAAAIKRAETLFPNVEVARKAVARVRAFDYREAYDWATRAQNQLDGQEAAREQERRRLRQLEKEGGRSGR